MQTLSSAAVNYRNFRFIVPDDVYRPAEDTYLLAENLPVSEGDCVLELGCGCGLVSVVAAEKAKEVVALDLNPNAVRATWVNAARNGFGHKVHVLASNLFDALNAKRLFDVILFNPPYLPELDSEPQDWLTRSWSGGESGSAVAEAFLRNVNGYLKPGGRLVLVYSSLSGVRIESEIVSRGFEVEKVSSLKFDFEEIYCVIARERH